MAQALINLSRADFELGRVEEECVCSLMNTSTRYRVAAVDADEAKDALDKIDKRRMGQLQAEMNRKKVHVRKKDDGQ